MLFLQGIWIAIIIALSLVRFKVGVAFYLAYIILVPFMNIKIGINLSWNFVNTLLVLAFLFERSKKHFFRIDINPLRPFIFYFGFGLIFVVFASFSMAESMTLWRQNAMQFMIVPFLLWNVMRFDASSILLYRRTMIISILVVAVYGLFLTLQPGVNPYLTQLCRANGTSFNENYALAEGAGRIFGRISSVFLHPMTFGAFLGFSLVYIFYLRTKINKCMFFTLFTLIVIDIVVCGVRSVIGGAVVAISYYFLKAKNYKVMFMSVVLGCLGWWIISFIPDLAEYVGSVADLKSSNVQGSSIEMRISQLQACFDFLGEKIAFGMGYAWTNWFQMMFGNHPKMYAFESLIIVVLCNFGVSGFALWFVMIKKCFAFNEKITSLIQIKEEKRNFDNCAILNGLAVFYLAYGCITGDYGYMQFFLLFYILLVGEVQYETREKIR